MYFIDVSKKIKNLSSKDPGALQLEILPTIRTHYAIRGFSFFGSNVKVISKDPSNLTLFDPVILFLCSGSK